VNHLDVALAARSFAAGRGIRSCTVRHRRLVPKPLAVVLWQLGAEPFSAAAIGWGDAHAKPQMAVAGEPRNRDLAFAALLEFAKWFNPRFEAYAADRETFTRGDYTFTVARSAPQVVVANRATVELLGRFGRRLAYLPTDGPRPADPTLVRLGRHLRFLWEHHSAPGQQLIVALTDLMNSHWATPQSAPERQSLPALDAFIDPPSGANGFDAAVTAEMCPVGPVPDADDEQSLMPLVERFNASRKGRTDPAVVGPLLTAITDHYRPLLRRTWDVLWRCRDREAAVAEARSVGRRWDVDRDAYTRHMDWLARNGLRRTRQTPRQAATTLRNLEEAGRLVAAEEACDDPLRMAADVLANKAVRGTVIAVEPNHKEPGPKRMVCRPLVTLRSPDPCLIPAGRELWWTGQPDGKEFVVEEVCPAPGGGSDVTLKLMTSSGTTALPAVGHDACFSAHSTKPQWLGTLPDDDPWTHVTSAPPALPTPLEDVLTPEV
jgi:hypothetical protein